MCRVGAGVEDKEVDDGVLGGGTEAVSSRAIVSLVSFSLPFDRFDLLGISTPTAARCSTQEPGPLDELCKVRTVTPQRWMKDLTTELKEGRYSASNQEGREIISVVRRAYKLLYDNKQKGIPEEVRNDLTQALTEWLQPTNLIVWIHNEKLSIRVACPFKEKCSDRGEWRCNIELPPDTSVVHGTTINNLLHMLTTQLEHGFITIKGRPRREQYTFTKLAWFGINLNSKEQFPNITEYRDSHSSSKIVNSQPIQLSCFGASSSLGSHFTSSAHASTNTRNQTPSLWLQTPSLAGSLCMMTSAGGC